MVGRPQLSLLEFSHGWLTACSLIWELGVCVFKLVLSIGFFWEERGSHWLAVNVGSFVKPLLELKKMK